MNLSIKRATGIFLSLSLLICSTAFASKNEQSTGYSEAGKASFYADKFQGRKTASGDIFNQNAKTAAHKKLPFGTKVKVTNLNNKKHVTVIINDRGPFVRGGVIDLSRSAFKAIGDLDSGILKVKLEVID